MVSQAKNCCHSHDRQVTGLEVFSLPVTQQARESPLKPARHDWSISHTQSPTHVGQRGHAPLFLGLLPSLLLISERPNSFKLDTVPSSRGLVLLFQSSSPRRLDCNQDSSVNHVAWKDLLKAQRNLSFFSSGVASMDKL